MSVWSFGVIVVGGVVATFFFQISIALHFFSLGTCPDMDF